MFKKTKNTQKKYFFARRHVPTFVPSKKHFIMNRTIYSFLVLLFSLSFMPDSNAQCEIWDVAATVNDCDGSVFYVSLNFNFDQVGNDGFTVAGNGNNYGNFNYADLPVQIGPLDGDGTTEYEFVVIDIHNNDCQDFTAIDPVFCPPGDCAITNLSILPSDCDGDNTYDITIDFDYQNPGNDFFEVTFGGENIGLFALADLPVTIENFEDNGEPSPALLVCINDQPNCCEDMAFDAPSCGGDCHIFDLHATNVECVDNEFWITLSFEFDNVGNDGFTVAGNGTNYGNFPYAEVPFTLGPLPADGTFYEFVVNDANHPDCGDFIDYGMVDCGPGNCEIGELGFETSDCHPDGTYDLWIDFEYANAPNDFFDVYYAGMVIGFYALADLPILIENFQDFGETTPVIGVCINDTPDCCSEGEFPSPCNGNDCEIWDVFAEAHDCDGDGNFLVDIEFNSNNTGAEGFHIVANGEEFGPFEYGETFYTFGPLSGGAIYEILVVDNEFLDCGGHFVLGPIFCDDNCHIYDLHASVTDCDDEGQFFVILDFEHQNTGNDGFKVVGNGNVYGFFDYASLPIEIGPFQSPVDMLEFIVTDVQHPDCGDVTEIDPPDCGGGGDCEISDLTADVTPCSSDGTFFVILNFAHQNTSEIAFSVHGNGISYGFFDYADLPVSIGPLVGNGTTPYEFVVNDILLPDCGAGIDVGPVECDILGDCQITDLVADASACNDDGTYNLWLNFDYANSPNIYFDVVYQGEIIGFFPLAELPVIIPHFPANDQLLQEITVCINDTPDCCATTTYEAPDCMGPDFVWPGDTESSNSSDHFDLLNIGVAFGAEGPARDVQGIEWTDLMGELWDQNFASGLNFIHADCDGNGTIDEEDIAAIKINFGESHDDVAEPVLIGGSENDPPFYVDLLNAGALVDGQQFSASIMLGNEDFPVDDLYGVAFTLNFDPELIDPASIQIKYDPSWLGVENVNLITFDRTAADEGTVKAALVRTDQNNVSGHGHVAEFIGIIDDIAGKEEMRVEISNVKAITSDEILVPLTRPVQVAGILTSTSEPIQGVFSVFPNPASTSVFLRHPQGLKAISVEVKNMSGMTVDVDLSAGNQLDVSGLPAGVYFLKIKTVDGVYLEKMVK